MDKILNWILLGNTQLSGLRTIILNTIAMIIAIWEFLDNEGGLFDMLCTSFQIMCNIGQTTFYAGVVAVLFALNNILRWLTVAPVGIKTTPAQLVIAHEAPNGEQKFATVIVVASVAAILAVIAIAVV